MNHHYLACDLGAESGRLMLGTLADGTLQMEELHRFQNTPIQTEQSLTWNMTGLFQGLKTGLKKAAERQLPIASISTDSWGVDYVLIDDSGNIMAPAYHYRDSRTARGVKAAHAKVAWESIFEQTGIQFMPFNSLYQLMAEEPGRLQSASSLLGIGDAFNYLMCGKAMAEVSFASTTQLYDPQAGSWAEDLIARLGIPRKLFPKLAPCGTRLGPITNTLATETGLATLEVIATCSHDTGAAVAAVPANQPNWAYVSSGTWSLMGVELNAPIINANCRTLNFTNEIGYGNTVRLLKNIVGLWIIQECRRHWASNGASYDYGTLTDMARKASPFAALINPSDDRFVSPGNMPGKIESFCRETGQESPSEPGAVIRCVLESLALLYRHNLEQIQSLVGSSIERLHIVGGGSKNDLLNQFTASALQIPVLAGPAEATAAGNILIQAIALGHLPSLQAARQVVTESYPLKAFQPQDPASWQSAWPRFQKLL